MSPAVTVECFEEFKRPSMVFFPLLMRSNQGASTWRRRGEEEEGEEVLGVGLDFEIFIDSEEYCDANSMVNDVEEPRAEEEDAVRGARARWKQSAKRPRPSILTRASI